MANIETMETLTGVFRQVFDDPEIVLTPATTADDIEGWDSLSHINLIVAVETQFNIRFKQKEVLSFKNVGDLANCVESKLPA
jgi:acyl carrier protein